MENTVTLEEIIQLAKQLSPVDKAGKSLRELWRGIDITDDDITER